MKPALAIGTGWFFVLVLTVLKSACGSSASSQAPHVVLHPQHGNAVRVSVDIADTEEKRQLGLMYRRDLPAMHGMLFLFPRERELSFWMKNTPLPLDIIYINSQRVIVSIAEHTMPFSERLIPSGKPAQFVLEVNAGFSQQYGIAAGDYVDLPDNLPPAQ